MTDALALDQRDRFPDALRVLLDSFPRGTWDAHDNFGALVQFWMERHVMFRRLNRALIEDAEAAVDGALAPDMMRARLSRFGGMLVGQLHEHHTVEDVHYFPRLLKLETGLQRGFDILDRDHHALDGLLQRFTESANAVLNGAEPGPLRAEILSFETMLNRHLEDEEDLIVPVILKHGESRIG